MADLNHETHWQGFSEKDRTVTIFILSDSTGETAECVTRAALRQFEGKHSTLLHCYRFVDTREKLEQILDLAQQEQALIIGTLASQELRACLKDGSAARGISAVDLMGPVVSVMSDRLRAEPAGRRSPTQRFDEEYFRRVKALQYSRTCDDGENPTLLQEADVVIVGVSRTGKTPLSMYLASHGVRTANVPLAPEIPPPTELFSLPSGRIVGLTLAPEILCKVRRDRLRVMGLDPEHSRYVQEARVREELLYADRVMARLGASVFDMTGKALEEVAHQILSALEKRSGTR